MVAVFLAFLLLSHLALQFLNRPRARQITNAVTLDRHGNIIFTPEEIADAERRVAEMEKAERERTEFLSQTEYSRWVTHTSCGNIVEYYHYANRISAADYFNVKKRINA